MSIDGDAVSGILWEVFEERDRQHAKWGEQNHPLVDQGAQTDLGLPAHAIRAHDRRQSAVRAAIWYEVPTADRARVACQAAAAAGRDTWAGILLEEFCEFLEAAAMGDEESARTELVQLGAVAAAAVEAIDRRKT